MSILRPYSSGVRTRTVGVCITRYDAIIVFATIDHHGGTLAGEDEAVYLFSDDASTKDTIR